MIRCFSSVASPRLKSRFFDAHTVSIWAQNVVKRKGNPMQAINMVMNRLDTIRRPSPGLFNTALDICGHHGLVLESARILHRMIAANVRPNERTITSILNGIAEHCQRLPLTESSDNSENGLPGLEDFKLKSKRDAAQLAVKLYSSWVEHSTGKVTRRHPFNAMLKVLWKSGCAELLPSVFPVEKDAQMDWVPEEPDVITFTTAIMASRHHPKRSFELASRYWYLAERANVPIDTGLMMAVLMVMRSSKDVTRIADLESRRATLKRIKVVLQKESVPVNTSNVFLEACLDFGSHSLGLEYWTTKLLPILEENQSMVKSHSHVNPYTISIVFRILLKENRPKDLYPLIEQLCQTYGMHVDTPLLNLLLVANRKLKDRIQADKLFHLYVRKCKSIIPDHITLYQMFTILKEDENLSVTEQRTIAKNLYNYFEKEHSTLLNNSKLEVRISKLFNALGLE